MIIIGAGMAGLLAGGMTKDQPSSIFEKQASLPNNHSSVLRFRTSAVGDALGIEFKEVMVMKAVASIGNPIADALSYSTKCTGVAMLRSISSANGELVKRYIAPPDLITQMSTRVDKITYETPLTRQDSIKGIISTIPMPDLMKLMDYPEPHPEFRAVPGVTVTAEIDNVDAYASLYIPDRSMIFNRVSITGKILTAEIAFPEHRPDDHFPDFSTGYGSLVVEQSLLLLGLRDNSYGLVNASEQPYSKILPIDEGARRRFVMWASDRGIYSYGRFATWRPTLLLDDLIHDYRVIRRLMANVGAHYEQRK